MRFIIYTISVFTSRFVKGLHLSMQSRITIYKHPQTSTTTHSHPQLSKTTHNQLQSFNLSKPSRTMYIYPQPSTTTHQYLKIPLYSQNLSSTVTLLHLLVIILKQTLTLIVIWNNACIYISVCVCLCVYTLQVILFTIFRLDWFFVFVSVQSNLIFRQRSFIWC